MTTQAPDREEIFGKLQSALKELLQLESLDALTMETTLQDELAVDSLGLVDLVVTLEESFDIRLPSTIDPAEIRTLSDVVDLVVKCLDTAPKVA